MSDVAVAKLDHVAPKSCVRPILATLASRGDLILMKVLRVEANTSSKWSGRARGGDAARLVTAFLASLKTSPGDRPNSAGVLGFGLNTCAGSVYRRPKCTIAERFGELGGVGELGSVMTTVTLNGSNLQVGGWWSIAWKYSILFVQQQCTQC